MTTTDHTPGLAMDKPEVLPVTEHHFPRGPWLQPQGEYSGHCNCGEPFTGRDGGEAELAWLKHYRISSQARPADGELVGRLKAGADQADVLRANRELSDAERMVHGAWAVVARLAADRITDLEAALSSERIAPQGDTAVTEALLGEVMQDAWGEICDDTGCHPLDIRREGGKLFYDGGHWTRLIALRLAPHCGEDGAGLCDACSLPAHELTQTPGCGGPLSAPTTERAQPLSLAAVKEIAAKVVQDACETDPADPEHPDTISITTGDLEAIVRAAIEDHLASLTPSKEGE